MITQMEKMLSKKIQEAEPSLDIEGKDLKVLQVATQDLTNYIKFISQTDKEPIPTDNPYIAEPSPNVDEEEMESFLTVWAGMWLNKWKQRFNLIIGQPTQTQCCNPAQPTVDVESIWLRIASREEMIELVANVLIQNSEIAGTRIIAENILKTQLSKKTNLDINDREQLFTFLNSALGRAREIAETTGPLVSIKVDKNYYCLANN
jgi:hypothetical protein